MGCVSQDSHPIKSFIRKKGTSGANHAVKGTWHQLKIRERRGPSRGIIQKCDPHEPSPCAGLRRGHKMKPCTKKDELAEQHEMFTS